MQWYTMLVAIIVFIATCSRTTEARVVPWDERTGEDHESSEDFLPESELDKLHTIGETYGDGMALMLNSKPYWLQ
ncbi:hypothetical protein CSKR_203546 [Clonorchis sinensis]|uniref:Uncharacterized protein n=1 Tax=Clonorchis sinensis TaxID=79923 RepID=A0A8T1MB94_CLOSI|nr:hypothetical protein CSKR_203546 [Clonorchis sinensis]